MAENTKNLKKDGLDKNPFVTGVAHAVIVDSNGTASIRSVGAKIQGVLVLGSDVPCTAQIVRRSKNTVTLKFTRHWEFLSRMDITSVPTSDPDFNVNINGDYDHNYKIDGYWKTSGTSLPTCKYLVNGLSGGLTSEGSTFLYSDGGGTPGAASGLMMAKSSTTAATEHRFSATLQAKSGSNRLGYSTDSTTFGTGATQQAHGTCGCKWEDTGVVIKTLGLEFSASDCEPGSWFELYRMREFDKTKVILWVY